MLALVKASKKTIFVIPKGKNSIFMVYTYILSFMYFYIERDVCYRVESKSHETSLRSDHLYDCDAHVSILLHFEESRQ